MEFSQQLIDRTKRYFLVRFGQQITDETADEYLGQFAELYSSMAVFAGSEGRQAAAAPETALAALGWAQPARLDIPS